MIVRGRASLAAPRDAVLAVLGAPERLVGALPNVDELGWEAEGNGAFSATIRPAIALGEVPLKTVWVPRQADRGTVRYRVEGCSDEHWLGFDVKVALKETDGATEAEGSIDYELTGTLRSVGQRAVAAVMAAQAGLVLDAVAHRAVGDGH